MLTFTCSSGDETLVDRKPKEAFFIHRSPCGSCSKTYIKTSLSHSTNYFKTVSFLYDGVSFTISMVELVSIVGLIIGIAIGYVIAKALKVAIIVGLIIVVLAYLGVTVISRSQFEDFLRIIMPALEWIKAFIESSQLFAIGLLIGFAIGLLK